MAGDRQKLIKIITICLSFIAAIKCFIFKAPSVICSTCTINTITSYQIMLFRSSDPSLATTPWNSQAVPAGSNITITFPNQFTLTGNENCISLSISYNSVPQYTCTVSIPSKTITISGAITSAIFIDYVDLIINNVMNPSPALMTSSFSAKIGTDVSASDDTGAVTLTAGSFQSIDIRFDPSTVNTTGNMVITAVLGDSLPSQSNIAVIFNQLTWAREITPGHTLPIIPTMSCSAITNIAYSVTCIGYTVSNFSVTLQNATNSNLTAGSTVKFSINNLFSPPTTEQLDTITLISYNGPYEVDRSSSNIIGLLPRTMNLAISTPNSFTINTQVVIQFDFVLVDTITRTNYVLIQFPIGSTVRYLNYFSTLNLTNITYNSTTFQLTMYQSSSSPNRNSGTAISLRVQSYTTPASVRTTDPFYLYIMSGTGYKMASSSTVNILPKSYIATVSTDNPTINVIASYSISFTLADSILSSGYFLILIPPQLSMSSTINVNLTGSSVSSTPLVEFVNTSSLRVRNINATSSNIATQPIVIKISGLTQPGSVKNISSFVINVYYSSANDLVAQAVSSTVITTTAGQIISANVSSSSIITAATSVYTFNIKIANQLNSGSRVIFTIPNQVLVNSGGVCTFQNSNINCSVASNLITMVLPSSLSALSNANFSYSNFINPSTTKPSGTFAVSTYNSALQLVDVMPSSITMFVVMTVPSAVTATSLTRGSKQNNFSTIYTFSFTQPQFIKQSTAVSIISFPADFSINTTPICTSGSLTLSCSLIANNQIKINFPSFQINNYSYNFTLASITNPYSFKPTPSILIGTYTNDSLYQYSSLNAGLQVTNVISSAFSQVSYSFTNQFLTQQTNLTINLTSLTTNTGYFIIKFAPSFQVNASSQISCFAIGFTPICSLQFNNITNNYEMLVQSTGTIPIFVSLSFIPLTNPSSIPTDYTAVSSYTTDSYLISQNKNTIQFSTFCVFPCRSCQNLSRNVCQSCYSPSSNLTNRIYLFQSQCLASCPSGYIEDTTNQVCIACSPPCFECQGSINYCVSCIPNSTYKYINRTSTTSTCLSECPIFMYPDLTQIPTVCVNCISPCSTCTNASSCLSCLPNYYLYGSLCLVGCPVNITVLINNTCINCSSTCSYCSIIPTNCTTCPNSKYLYDGGCYTTCPNNLIPINSICVSCDDSCKTCSILTTNCTSCYSNGTYIYFYSNMCLAVCPNFYYSDSFNVCNSCDLLNIGCKNCSSPTICASCDPGYTLLNFRCLNSTPDGYLNISGIAVPCEGDCATCSIILSNCTSCRTLNLLNNTCSSTCPLGTVALNRICQLCTYPCLQCSSITTNCTRCYANSSLYLYNTRCVPSSSCPTFTYANNNTQSCTACVSPCSQCNSSTICTTCINGYFYVNSSSSCQTTCPPLSVGINRMCQSCINPCNQCINSTTKCLSCIDNFYYNQFTYQCLTSCPSGQIPNDTIMQCQTCVLPCKTCINTTDTCLSCVLGTFLSNNLCVTVCPIGQYGASGLCKNCENNCSTCTNSVNCTSCINPLFLYSNKCLVQCPVAYAIVSVDNVCLSCATVVQYCSNCSIDGFCYACFYPNIYFNSTCWSSCPTGYKYANLTCQVVTQADVVLNTTLQSYTFPIPFTILGCVVFIACCMSKLQNHNTYLIGTLYSCFGIIQTGCFAYLLYLYIMQGQLVYVLNNIYILSAVAASIYLLNILGLIIQTPYLLSDYRFNHWLKAQNKLFFSFITLLSLLVNYKSKMILFTKLFHFQSTSAMLDSVHKFRLFNIFSFFGILPEALALYVCFICIFKFTFANVIYQAFLDTIIIFLINVLLAVLIVWKPDQFFEELTQDGIAINKRIIDNNVQDYSKQAINASSYQNQVIFHGPDSYNPLGNVTPLDEIEQVSSQLSASLNNQTYNKNLRNIKVYFGAEDTSQNNNSIVKSKVSNRVYNSNIFQSNEYNDKRVQLNKINEQPNENSMPNKNNLNLKEVNEHEAVVISQVIKQTKQNEQDINKRIKQKQSQLNLIKQQLLNKQSNQNKSQCKVNDSAQYEQISIKDSSQKQNTGQDSNTKTIQQLAVNNVHLPQQTKQNNVEEDVEQKPRQSIGSWLQLKIVQENRKLPVFSQQATIDGNNISLPQSQFQNYLDKNQYIQSIQKQKCLPAQQLVNQEDENYVIVNSTIKNSNVKNQSNFGTLEQKDYEQIYRSQKQKNITKKQRLSKQKIQKQRAQNIQTQNQNNVFDQQFDYQEEGDKKIIDNQVQGSIRVLLQSQGQNNKFQFEQEGKDFDNRAGTRLNFQRAEPPNQIQQNSLDDSQYEQDRIVQRPFSAARNKKPNNQALIQILSKAQNNNNNGNGNNGRKPVHRIIQRANTNEVKQFQDSKHRFQNNSHNDNDQLEERSRMYLAGRNQFKNQTQGSLHIKKKMNHPLNSMKKKSIQDSQNSDQMAQKQKSRNKSFSNTPFRKFTSKDIASDQLDELGLEYQDYKKNYNQLMNERQRYKGQKVQKPQTSRGPRSNNQKIRRQTTNNFNFRQQLNQNDDQQDQSLNRYYFRQKRGNSFSREKVKKSPSKQKTLEQTKRIKQLQRIYLPKNK